MILNLFLIIILIIILLFYFILQIIKNKRRNKNKENNNNNSIIKIGIFHPHCDHGGGGERVLWMIISSILNDINLSSNVEISIYCTNNNIKSKEVILSNVMNKFHISISKNHYSKLSFISIPGCHLLDGSRYPYFTMLFQMLAMIYIGLICIYYYIPDIYLDTTGVPFMYPIFKLFQCQVVTYIHYPILSSDMLHKVREMRPSYNNDQRIASSQSVSFIKLYYYRALGYFFSLTGYSVDLAFVNSTWTERHMLQMWHDSLKYSSSTHLHDSKSEPFFCGPKELIKLYPPCNTKLLQNIPLGTTSHIGGIIQSNKSTPIITRKRNILSVGQFRPEKDHPLQILSFARFLKENQESKYQEVQLVILGSCRNSDDEKLLHSLQNLTNSLKITENVKFVVNAPFESLENYLSESAIGLHTMWNEHFGISIVEMLAAGLLVIAHNSGGPSMDIIPSTTGPNQIGYLASTEIEYSKCMKDAVDMLDNEDECLAIRSRGRESTKQFSDEIFESKIVNYFTQFITKCNSKDK